MILVFGSSRGFVSRFDSRCGGYLYVKLLLYTTRYIYFDLTSERHARRAAERRRRRPEVEEPGVRQDPKYRLGIRAATMVRIRRDWDEVVARVSMYKRRTGKTARHSHDRGRGGNSDTRVVFFLPLPCAPTDLRPI